MKKYYLFLLCSAIFLGCGKIKLKNELKDFVGLKITIPHNLQATVQGKDTLLSGFGDRDMKLVVFFDSVGCSSCQVKQMNQWQEIIDFSKATKQKFNIVFIFSPKIGKSFLHEVRNSLRASQFSYPVFIDTLSSFLSANPAIPDDKRFHTFLLDENNKVVLVGNPQGNEKLWQLYKGEIQNRIADKIPSTPAEE